MTLGNWIPTLLGEFWTVSTSGQIALAGGLIMFVSGLARISGGLVLLRINALRIANVRLKVRSLACRRCQAEEIAIRSVVRI